MARLDFNTANPNNRQMTRTITQLPQAAAAAVPSAEQRFYNAQQQINQVAQKQFNTANPFNRATTGGMGGMYTPEFRGTRFNGAQRVEMNPFERGIATLSGPWANSVANVTGFDPSKLQEDPFGTIARFAGSLPFMTLSGFMMAPGNAYEAITGKPIFDNPYTEEKEVDLSTGTRLDYNLDLGQRATAGLNTFINTGLAGAGATGRAFGLATSLATKGARGGRMLGGWMKSPVGQLAFDTAQEASEEFVQSYLDDIRYDNLGADSLQRALEASAWGAAGGAMMHGGVKMATKGVNKVGERTGIQWMQNLGKTRNEEGQEVHPDVANEQVQVTEDRFAALKALGGNLANKDYTAEALRDAQLNGRSAEVPGSFQVKHGRTNFRGKMDDLSVSVQDFARSWNNGYSDRVAFVRRLGINPDDTNAIEAKINEVDRALRTGEYNGETTNAADALTRLIMNDTNGNGIKIAFGRNPDTRNGGFYLDLKGFTEGGDALVHPVIYSIVGADADGDTSTIYFDLSKTNFMGYASEMFSHPEGRSNIDWVFSSVPYRSISRGAVQEAFQDALGQYEQQSPGIVSRYTDLFMSAQRQSDDDVTQQQLSAMMTRLGGELRGMGVSDRDSRNAISTFFQSASSDIGETMVQNLAPFADRTIREEIGRNILGTEEAASEEEVNAVLKRLYRQGSLGDASHPVHLYEYIGLLTYHLTGKGNLIFRQYGEMGYGAKRVGAYKDWATKFAKFTDDTNVFDSLIRISFKMSQSGVSPLTAIEGIVDSYVVAKTLGEIGSRRISSQDDVDFIMDAFKRHYNEMVKTYNDAQKVATQNGFEIPFGTLERFNIDDATGRDAFRAFVRVFGKAEVGDFIDVSNISGISESQSIEDFIKPLANKGEHRFPVELVALGKGPQNFLDSLVTAYGSENTTLSNAVRKHITDIDLGKAYQRLVDGTATETDQIQLAMYVDSIGMVLDPQIAFETGLYGNGLLGTDIGQRIFGPNKNERINAVTALGFHQSWQEVFDAFAMARQLEEEGDLDRAAAVAVEAADMCRSKMEISSIHSAVGNQLLKSNGRGSALFDYLTNLDVSFETKEREWKRQLAKDEQLFATEDLLLDMIRTESSDLEFTTFGARMRKAKDAASRAAKLNYDSLMAEVLEHEQDTQFLQDNQYIQFMNWLCNEKVESVNLDILGNDIMSAFVVNNSKMEKGVNEASGTLMYQSLQNAVNGGQTSYANQVFGLENGVVELQEFRSNPKLILKCIGDPTFEIRVYDKQTGQFRIVNQMEIFKSVDPGFKGKESLTRASYIALFKKYPVLMGALGEQMSTPSMKDGIVSAKPARSRTVKQLLEEWVGGHDSKPGATDKSVEWKKKMQRQASSLALLNDNEYKVIIARQLAASPRIDIDGQVTLRQINDEVIRLHNENVRVFTHALNHSPDGKIFENQLQDYFYDTLETNTQILYDALTLANDKLGDITNMSQVGRNVFRTATDAAKTQIFAYLVRSKASSLQNKALEAAVQNVAVPVSTGNLSSVVDPAAIMKTYESTVKKMLSVMTAVSNIYDDAAGKGNIGQYWTLDADLVNDFANSLRNDISNQNITDQEKAKAIAELDNVLQSMTTSPITTLFNKLGSTVKAIPVVLNNDKSSKAAFVSVVDNIVSFAGMSKEDVADDYKAIDQAFAMPVTTAAERQARKDKIDSLALYWNNRGLESNLRSIRLDTGAKINANFLGAQSSAFETISRLLKTAHEKVPVRYQDAEIMTGDEVQRGFNLPPMDFTSPTGEAIANQLRVMSASSYVESTVGINGGQTKQIMGLGFIPDSIIGQNIPTVDVPAANILNRGFKIRGREVRDNWRCTFSPAGVELSWDDVMTIEDARSILRSNPGAATTIRIFDPMDNAHGAYDTHSPAAPVVAGNGYHRLRGLLGLLMDESQEGMVLKAKKNFLSSPGNIVDEYKVDRATKESLTRNAFTGSVADIRAQLRNKLDSCRDGYATSLVETFGKGTKLGFDYDRCLILAQGLTPAYQLVFSDGTSATFDVESLFTSEQEFAAEWEAVTMGRQVELASVMFVTPEELSYKIIRGVRDEWHRVENSDDEVGPGVGTCNDAAVAAIRGWSNANVNELPVTTILSGINPVGRSVRGIGIASPDSRTPFQFIMDQAFNENSSAYYNTANTLKHEAKALDETEAGRARLAHVLRNRNIFATRSSKDRTVLVYQAFISRDDMLAPSKVQAINNFRAVSSGPLDGAYSSDNEIGAGLLLEDSMYSAAMDWGARNGSAIIMPKRLADQRNVSPRAFLGDIDKNFAPGYGKLVLIDPWEAGRRKLLSGNMPTSSLSALSPDEIYGALVDEQNNYGLTDAEGRAFPSVGNIIVTDARHETLSAKQLLGNTRNGISVASREEILALKAKIDSNPDDINNWSDFDFRYALNTKKMYDRVAKDKVMEFLDNIEAQDAYSDGIIRDGAGKGMCVALVKNGLRYAPIFLPDNTVQNLQYVNVETHGGNVTTSWMGETSLGDSENSRIKMMIDGEAYKFEVTNWVNGETAPAYIGNTGDMLHFVINADTQKSRAYGKHRIFMIRDMWYYHKHRALKDGYNLLFKKPQNGRVELKDNIVAAIKSRYPSDYKKRIVDLITGEFKPDSIWADVAGGAIDLIPGISPRQKELLKSTTIACQRYGVSPMQLFCPYDMDVATISFDDNTDRVSGKLNDDPFDINFMMMLGDMSENDCLEFFNMIDSRLCPQNMAVQNPTANMRNATMFDQNGKFLTKLSDGSLSYETVRWGPHASIGDESGLKGGAGRSKLGPQHMYRRAYDQGYIAGDIKNAVQYAQFLTNDPSFYESKATRLQRRLADGDLTTKVVPDGSKLDVDEAIQRYVDSNPFDTFTELKHRATINKHGWWRRHIRVVTEQGETVDIPSQNERVSSAIEYFKSTVGDKVGWNYQQIEMLSARQAGYVWMPGTENTVTVNQLASSIREMADNFKDKGLLISNRGGTKNKRDRYALAMMSDAEIGWLWDNSTEAQAKWGTREQLVEAIKEEGRAAHQQLETISPAKRSKRIALEQAFEFDFNQWGDTTGNRDYIYANTYTFDMVEADSGLARALSQGSGVGLDVDPEVFRQLCDQQRIVIQDMKNQAENQGICHITLPNGQRSRAYFRVEEDKNIRLILNNATELSKIMALFNPGVMVSNAMDRFVSQSVTHAGIVIGNKLRLGPFAAKHVLNSELVKLAVNNDLFVKMYIAYRQAAFKGDELEFLANAKSAEEIEAWLDERRERMTPYQRFCDRIYGLASGGNAFIKTQMENFIYRFGMFAEQTPGQEFWFDDAGNGMTRLEAAIQADSGQWFLSILGMNGKGTPSFTIAMQAMNAAKKGDMAQRNVISMMFAEAARKHPAFKFFTITAVSRFPQYTLNVAGRFLNWVMPISSINYVFTEAAAKMGRERAERKGTDDPHYELAHVNASLREAILVDITHLGVSATAAVLVALSGGIEPPDDEKKWGNIEEWTVFGMRVGESWWIQDILGMALPDAAFMKSLMLGKPRFDIITNGTATVLYNNPLVKVADAVGFFMDPEGAILTDYEQDLRDFKNVKGGISFADYLQANATSFGLSWIQQFFTPSIVREWWQSAQQWEASYKRIYEETPSGKLTAAGEAGKTVPTTYHDAMLRRVTRRNPILGWMFDQILSPNTGYQWNEMPNTVYYDDTQLAQQEQWSIKGLDPTAANAKIMEIITVMQQYDDMEELVATGFSLDYETRAALSQTCWDIIYDIKQWWAGLQESGQLNYKNYPSYEIFSQVKAQYQSFKDSQVNYWQNFYYDKIRSSALSESIVQYRRYNTTYRPDVFGDVYATGMRPQSILPFVSAPGQLGDPETTAGYENDWATVSAATGKPMGLGRALVPYSTIDSDWPSDLEYWSGDGQGNGYSEFSQSWTPASGASDEDAAWVSPASGGVIDTSGGGSTSVPQATPDGTAVQPQKTATPPVGDGLDALRSVPGVNVASPTDPVPATVGDAQQQAGIAAYDQAVAQQAAQGAPATPEDLRAGLLQSAPVSQGNGGQPTADQQILANQLGAAGMPGAENVLSGYEPGSNVIIDPNTGLPVVSTAFGQRSGGSGGYSRSRRSGGGGGGRSSVPTVYSRFNMPNAPRISTVMGNTYPQRANFDYLRPAFKKQGSRDAYTRSDI